MRDLWGLKDNIMGGFDKGGCGKGADCTRDVVEGDMGNDF